jgi:hypothetical protein
VRPKGVADGQQVNIPAPPGERYHDGVTQKDRRVGGWTSRWLCESRIPQANPWGHSTVRQGPRPHGRKVSDSTLSGKTSKESARRPYLKPTQVDKDNIQRRSRERLLRN